ncbi:MAG: HAMP domain-containing histidine kinase [Candidatus Eisenbacteria bacterium]|uniref:histidine kinase n=1 Tax=Eiseniibacteriota bacterium TaxID=2212470 RepID=A0A956RPK3_UNCEI|nr:HAMP domain-containing histidine kinase [Candidatus Eisenbacteria bacterium]
MTLKVRLATMMIMVLVAVLVLQFLLMERDRRLLADRLEEMSSGLDRTSAVFVEHARELAGGGPSRGIDSLLHDVIDESRRESGRAHFTLVVWADSSRGAPVDSGMWWGGIEEYENSFVRIAREDGSTGIGGSSDSSVVERSGHRFTVVRQERMSNGDSVEVTLVADGTPPPRNVRIPLPPPRPSGLPSAQDLRRLLPRAPVDSAGYSGMELVVNLPVAADSDSFYAVQVRYPFDSINDELARSRRRGLLWMAAVIGLGAFGAVLVAGQFTGPIHTLQRSFGRVVAGDLDLEVKRERRDEIGQLTDSFNDMVKQLKEARVSETRLAEAERLASVGRMAAGVAHEVRNPLNAILLTMQQMRSRVLAGADPASFDRYYAVVTGEIARLERMVGAFLDLSRAGILRTTPLDLTESLETSVRVFEQEAETRQVKVRRDWHGPLRIEADPSRLPMVWSNLLANALAVTEPGGEIVVSARTVGVDGGGDPVVPSMEVIVRDDGPGFDPATLPRIWEPFYSGREGGTGLGLAIVRAAVEQHHGTVQAGNGERGAWVRVVLPVRPDEFSPAGGQPGPRSDRRGPGNQADSDGPEEA